ncbi:MULTISPECIES: NAD-dependent epimerase/dehydratase family protein [Halobacteriovorax]|uniref:NAD-dependent epimerase/dehydratase family protein n=1 Tax=Halobacteriovorax vibrionivorans TaxID=2152716 RepID=A0ABY0IHH2_9BACT|nr:MULTISPECIES: NAD-dependent epimerase/dehydratase family protein [Halobacteriovorax]RZF20782.1 NAD-dependent epimerase/dehydratase family protein [Halobacteriovorax vibrionivorans]TGD45739.1 NAD-dependent epimerase/dehydratase family protein [Halobacteriovorax sp. Y22]
MRVLVTGVTGFLGYHIAKDLLKDGHEVINFSRRHTSEVDELGIETIKGDLTNYEDIKNALRDIDAVFHAAGKVGMWGKSKDFHRINVDGTKNLVNAMKEQGAKYLIYTSTPSVVFGKDEIKNGDESLPYPKKYLNEYAKSKSIAERFVLESNGHGILTTSIRPHLIYGERDKNIIPRLIQRAKSGRLKIIGDGQNLVDINYVENASHAHVMALKELSTEAKNQGKAYFIGQEKPVNLWDFINKILEAKGEKPISSKVSLKIVYFIGLIFELVYKLLGKYDDQPPMTRFVALQMGTSHYFKHDNARVDFGYSPKITIEESLEKIKN